MVIAIGTHREMAGKSESMAANSKTTPAAPNGDGLHQTSAWIGTTMPRADPLSQLPWYNTWEVHRLCQFGKAFYRWLKPIGISTNSLARPLLLPSTPRSVLMP